MKQCIKRNSKILKFLLTLSIIALITGIVFYLNLSQEHKESIILSLNNLSTNLKNTHQNNIIFHLFIISVVVLFSLTFFLYPITIFYLFYEIMSFGFILTHYFSNNGIGGIIYSLIYFILNKAVFFLVLIYILITSFLLIKKTYNSIRKKDNISVRELYTNYFLKILISTSTIFIFDIIIYFFGNKIMSLFQFLL